MVRESECEHDIGVYRIVGGNGLDVVEECSDCGTRITSESPKTKFENEIKEEELEERKKKRATNKRKRTIAKKEVEEEPEEDGSFFGKAKYKVEDLFD